MQEQAQLQVPSLEGVHGSPLRLPVITRKGSTGKGEMRPLFGTLITTDQAKAAETPVTALQHEIRPADCIKSAADALNKGDHSSQPDGSKPGDEQRHCQQAGCSSHVGTEVQVCICANECRNVLHSTTSFANCCCFIYVMSLACLYLRHKTLQTKISNVNDWLD